MKFSFRQNDNASYRLGDQESGKFSFSSNTNFQVFDKEKIRNSVTNLIGKEINLINTFLEDSRYKTYNYGKKEVREGRKMGHINRIIEKDSNVSKFMP